MSITVSIRKKEFSDKSKSYFLDLWQNENEIKYSLPLRQKQFNALKKQGVEETNHDILEFVLAKKF